MIFYYEIADALTLLWTLTAAGFGIVSAIKGYRSQNYIKSGFYAMIVVFLVGSTVFYFQAYMSMLPFLTVVIGSLLLFIHFISILFDNKLVKQALPA